jgi:hypothetical protein
MRTISSGRFPNKDTPFQVTEPEEGFSNPEIVRSNVLFPAPLAPITVVILDSTTVIDTEFNATTEP